jgi:mannose-6-phosphate isomerase-like protein (cupin superfamily)
MKHAKLRFAKGFHVIFGNRRAQIAEMVVASGATEGDPGNRHRGADQWLYVVSGTGLASVNGKRLRLRPGVLLLIERGERHEIRNTGHGLLRTLNYYSPPAYTKTGDELPAARRN